MAALILSLAAPTARAATFYTPLYTGAPAGNPVLVTAMDARPSGYRLTPRQVLQVGLRSPRVRSQLRRLHHVRPYVYTHGNGQWQISWFSIGPRSKELMQVYIDDSTGTVEQVWTGYQVAWTMARGYPGAFGRRVNALYVWLPMCALFLIPFLPWPGRLRSRRGASSSPDDPPWRPTLLHLDLLVLLSFSVSLALFNHADIGLSVPLVYPPLVYLLARMLLLAFGRGRPRGPLPVRLPSRWLLCGVLFLLAFRIGLNVLNSNVIDVGYAGVIGAWKLLHGHVLYGFWPHDNAYGDTYGPVTYYAYVPFTAIFGWSGTWDSLPAAHAAAIAFDLLSCGGLYLLGRRLRGHRVGLVLAWLWTAYPFTLYALSSNTNDALLSLLVVAALLVISSAPARGVMAALAGMTKFAPFALAPLLARGTAHRPPRPRALAAFAIAFAVVGAASMIPVLTTGDLGRFWHDSVLYQADRVTPFSIWGLWGGLSLEQQLCQGATVGLAVLVAFYPERRGLVEVAALGAAVLIALQLTANYWLYPYVVWFFPLVAVALMGAHVVPDPRRAGAAGLALDEAVGTVALTPEPAAAPARSPWRASAQAPP